MHARLKGHIAVLEYAVRGEFEDTSDWQIGSGFIESIEFNAELPHALHVIARVMTDVDTPVLEYKGHVILYQHRCIGMVTDRNDDGFVFPQPFKQHGLVVHLVPQANRDGCA